MTTRRQIDRTSTYYWQDMVRMMSNESLREYARERRSTMGIYARAELARRDLEIGLAE